MSPLSNSYLKSADLEKMEPFYPLHAFVCESCFLVQLPEFQSPEQIFSDYAYFSSYSDSWLEHSKSYAERMTGEYGLGSESLVVEVASNDGYLLQYFQRQNVPVLGVEPARNVAAVAQAAGIPTIVKFFGVQTALELADAGQKADLLVGNNVLGHVPDLNDFIAGLQILLKPHGVLTMEFPHLLQLMEGNEFDTIYHEHFSYWSLLAVEKAFAAHGLTLFDVESIRTHGGSLRIFARHDTDETRAVSARVEALRQREDEVGLNKLETYAAFSEQVHQTKRNLLEFLIRAKREEKAIVGYGAPAKGNTLLNYCGVRTDFINYTVDRSPHKQDLFLPGTHIPVFHPDKINETKPDYLLILPWNLQEEIMEQMSHVREWGCRFVVPIPTLEVIP
jgi:2-polyprenyl-3-methyl-5-hydroxy-6-metoxy-1,4-benzoquinol methylase